MSMRCLVKVAFGYQNIMLVEREVENNINRWMANGSKDTAAPDRIHSGFITFFGIFEVNEVLRIPGARNMENGNGRFQGRQGQESL